MGPALNVVNMSSETPVEKKLSSGYHLQIAFWLGVEACFHFPLSGLEPCWLECVQALLALLFKCWEILGNIGLQISFYQTGRIIKFVWLG